MDRGRHAGQCPASAGSPAALRAALYRLHTFHVPTGIPRVGRWALPARRFGLRGAPPGIDRRHSGNRPADLPAGPAGGKLEAPGVGLVGNLVRDLFALGVLLRSGASGCGAHVPVGCRRLGVAGRHSASPALIVGSPDTAHRRGGARQTECVGLFRCARCGRCRWQRLASRRAVRRGRRGDPCAHGLLDAVQIGRLVLDLHGVPAGPQRAQLGQGPASSAVVAGVCRSDGWRCRGWPPWRTARAAPRSSSDAPPWRILARSWRPRWSRTSAWQGTRGYVNVHMPLDACLVLVAACGGAGVVAGSDEARRRDARVAARGHGGADLGPELQPRGPVAERSRAGRFHERGGSTAAMDGRPLARVPWLLHQAGKETCYHMSHFPIWSAVSKGMAIDLSSLRRGSAKSTATWPETMAAAALASLFDASNAMPFATDNADVAAARWSAHLPAADPAAEGPSHPQSEPASPAGPGKALRSDHPVRLGDQIGDLSQSMPPTSR